MPPQGKPVDITRMNRTERRKLRQRIHLTIPGRNLPYVKAQHGTLAAFNEMREKEMVVEQKQHEHTQAN